jgi:arylsulfatase
MPRNALVPLATAIFSAFVGCGDAALPRSNLLLITVDTLRADRLTCYGGGADVGRALCAVAETGTLYLWAISSAPSTAPAIASLLTSRYPSSHGVSQFASTALADDARTLAEEFGDGGYATAAFISNPVLQRERNLDQGFEIYDAQMTRRERNRGVAERDAEATTDAALAWVKVSPQPWFLWVHYQDPHGPYQPPDAEPARDTAGGTSLSALADHSGRHGIPAYQVLPQVYEVQTYEERYLEEIRYLDRHLDRLVAGSRALDPPLGILITADHGEAFGEDDYWFAHGHSVGLDQIRIPMLWSPPGGTQPGVVPTPVSIIDVGPTLLAAAGLPIPESFRGEPLPTAESSPSPTGEGRVIFAEHRLRAAVLRDRDYYGRDREPLEEPVRDAISGGRLHPIEPRTARLPLEGGLARYRAVREGRGGQALESILAYFLHASGGPREAEPVDLGDEMREQLRALGYLE